MLVRLTIGDDQELMASQTCFDQIVQGILRPHGLLLAKDEGIPKPRSQNDDCVKVLCDNPSDWGDAKNDEKTRPVSRCLVGCGGDGKLRPIRILVTAPSTQALLV
jgi:hypothetical protein